MNLVTDQSPFTDFGIVSSTVIAELQQVGANAS
jgi:hypothetical protein